jgi:hypothetical protein
MTGDAPWEFGSHSEFYLFCREERANSLQRLSDATSSPAGAAKFNEQFMGPAGLKVRKDIASPALWNVKALLGLAEQYGASSADAKEIFRDLCKFKWAFRIKADLVIVMPGLNPICIEGKLESREGTYPTKPAETKMFDDVFGTRAARRAWVDTGNGSWIPCAEFAACVNELK